MRNGSRGPRRAQRWVSPIWLWPVVSGALALAVGVVAMRLPLPESWSQLAWPGNLDSASAMVQTVASTVVTVTTVTFTLTVVALQLASQQFSPRLLREFTRDPVVKAVLSVLVAAFALALTVLRGLGGQDSVPALAALLVFLAGLASLGAVLAFITHLVRVLRIDTMMLAVHDETRNAVELFYPAHDDRRAEASAEPLFPAGTGRLVLADRSGFVRTIAVEELVAALRAEDAVANVMVRPGDHVIAGTPVAEAWQRDGNPAEPSLDPAVLATVEVDYERTLEQDAAFGFRQLEDIAVKALSPGINDPVTAAHSIGHMGDLLSRLTRCRLGASEHRDAEGHVRAVVPDRDLAYYLELSCGQVRRYGRHEPTVLAALLRMLRDVASSVRDDGQRTAVADAADLVLLASDDELLPGEVAALRDLRGRVDLALRGRLVEAYTDRSGETRSI